MTDPIRCFDPRTVSSRQLPLTARSALISVDMQNADASATMRKKGMGGSPKPPRTAAFYTRLHEIVVPNQVRLHSAARQAGLENIYVIIESLTQDGRDRGIDHKVSGIHLPPGSSAARVIDEVAPRDDDIVLRKTASGAFGATSLDYVLRNLGIEQLIVFGIVTHQCVENTVRQGADIGYLVTVVDDACATDSDEIHKAALSGMSGYARVKTTDEVLAELTTIDR
ncbi:MAG: isochorismatase family cysteine hydrolase [Gammaproteobacteria bacterium]|nr:isochorismatase family cysteine hydrolase [Gammaproteobacteria bacterium]